MSLARSSCRVCGRPLRNAASIALGVGKVCRIKGKYVELTNNQLSMMSRANCEHFIQDGILCLEDMGGDFNKSLTNDMENCLNDIQKVGIEFWNYQIIYRDSEGTWDGVQVFMAPGFPTSIKFYSINCTDLRSAIIKAKKIHSSYANQVSYKF